MFNKFKGLIITLSIVVALMLIIGLSIVIGFNNAVKKQTTIENNYAQISVALEMRFEKLELLLGALTGLEEHVETQLTKITDARAKLSQGADLNDISEEVEAGFRNIVVLIEDNPNSYIAVAAYNGYMAEISATINLIMTTKIIYNDAVTDFNRFLRQFPRNLYLPALGFSQEKLYDPNLVSN
ncbi:MAG: LemA family protein [Acholeplasmataceae bacterium]|jgi:LemA protein|nr:LemA family protein [Acholeplasmataceae bacterium]